MRSMTLMGLDAELSQRQREDSAAKYATAFIKAAESGEPQLHATGVTLDLEVCCSHCCQASQGSLRELIAASA